MAAGVTGRHARSRVGIDHTAGAASRMRSCAARPPRKGKNVPMTHPRVLLHGDESGERIGVVESVMPAGAAGPALHRHDFDEAFSVLDGELTFYLGGELVRDGVEPPDWGPAGAPARHAARPADRGDGAAAPAVSAAAVVEGRRAGGGLAAPGRVSARVLRSGSRR
jgi:hypothetical protein